MALHLVHEAAFCVNGLRNQRSLTQKGFELSNGLPFVPTDFAIHEMLGRRTMAQAQKALQVALGKIRRASGHFQGRLLGIDPLGLAISFALPTFAQQKDTVDPKVEQQIRALVVRPATIRQRTRSPDDKPSRTLRRENNENTLASITLLSIFLLRAYFFCKIGSRGVGRPTLATQH